MTGSRGGPGGSFFCLRLVTRSTRHAVKRKPRTTAPIEMFRSIVNVEVEERCRKVVLEGLPMRNGRRQPVLLHSVCVLSSKGLEVYNPHQNVLLTLRNMAASVSEG